MQYQLIDSNTAIDNNNDTNFTYNFVANYLFKFIDGDNNG